MFAEIFITALTAVSIYMLGFWVLSLALKDVSIVDIGWGLGFVVVAWTVHLTSESNDARATLSLIHI